MSSSGALEDDKVCDELRSFFTSHFPRQTFKLWFTYYGMPYFTTFDAEHTDKQLYVRNNCIKMVFVSKNESKGLNPYEGRIAANMSTTPCFTPRLARQSLHSSVDVLQTLKTKIATLFPMFPAYGLCITDIAEKDGVTLSHFRILRGGDAIYEKYGYQSEFITALKEYIRTLTWGDIKMTEIAGNINGILEFINETEGKMIPTGFAIQDAALITTILRDITFDHEVEYQKKYSVRFFSRDTLNLIGTEFIKKHNATSSSPIPATFLMVSQIGTQNAWVFCLDPDSDAWRISKDALRFSHVEIQPTSNSAAASSRKTRRRRRY